MPNGNNGGTEQVHKPTLLLVGNVEMAPAIVSNLCGHPVAKFNVGKKNCYVRITDELDRYSRKEGIAPENITRVNLHYAPVQDEDGKKMLKVINISGHQMVYA